MTLLVCSDVHVAQCGYTQCNGNHKSPRTVVFAHWMLRSSKGTTSENECAVSTSRCCLIGVCACTSPSGMCQACAGRTSPCVVLVEQQGTVETHVLVFAIRRRSRRRLLGDDTGKNTLARQKRLLSVDTGQLWQCGACWLHFAIAVKTTAPSVAFRAEKMWSKEPVGRRSSQQTAFNISSLQCATLLRGSSRVAVLRVNSLEVGAAESCVPHDQDVHRILHAHGDPSCSSSLHASRRTTGITVKLLSQCFTQRRRQRGTLCLTWSARVFFITPAAHEIGHSRVASLDDDTLPSLSVPNAKNSRSRPVFSRR